MLAVKELVKQVLGSMDKDIERAVQERCDIRKAFYNFTSRVYVCTAGDTIAHAKFYNYLPKALYTLFDSDFSNMSINSCDVLDISEKTNTAKYSIKGVFRVALYNGGHIRIAYEYETKRAVKISTFLTNFYEWMWAHICDAIREEAKQEEEEEEEFDIAATVKLPIDKQVSRLCKGEGLYSLNQLQSVIKEIVNIYKAYRKPLYIYYTAVNYKDHYDYLKNRVGVASCMTHPTNYYFKLTEYVDPDIYHPLCGYDYAPDFRLALVSELSPIELQQALDNDAGMRYPFIMRAVVFTGDRTNPAFYTRAYGDEKAKAVFSKKLVQNEKPYGRELYGVPVPVRYNEELYEDTLYYICEHNVDLITAPYVDCRCPTYVLGSDLVTREDGREVVAMEVLDTTDEGIDKSRNDVAVLSASDGLLFRHDADGGYGWRDYNYRYVFSVSDNKVKLAVNSYIEDIYIKDIDTYE